MAFGFELAVIAAMLLFNAIFAAYEMALAAISRVKISFLVDEKRKGAHEALFMKDRMEASLTVIQIGITLVGALAAAAGGAGVEKVFTPYLMENAGMSKLVAEITALILFIIPLTFLTIIFGELVPKTFALNNKERVILALSPPMKVLSSALNPVVSVVEAILKKILSWTSKKYDVNVADEKRARLHELKSAVALARVSRLLGVREERMILSAAQLSTRPVREIMIPASDIFMIYSGSTLMDAFLQAHLDMHTRFPVCAEKENSQTIEGYINFKDIVVAFKTGSGETGLRGIIRAITRVPDAMTISEALEKMLHEKTHIILVVSSEQRVLGIVTMEDIMEELVGEVEDEFDRPSSQIQPYGPSWLMGGAVPMTVAASKLGLDWSRKYENGKVPTLQEWCVGVSGRPLSGGEVLENEGIRVVPRKFRRKRLIEAVVSLPADQP